MENEIVRIISIAVIACLLAAPIFAGWFFAERWLTRRKWNKFISDALEDAVKQGGKI